MTYFSLCYHYSLPDITEYDSFENAKDAINVDSDDCTEILVFDQDGTVRYINDFYADKLDIIILAKVIEHYLNNRK